MLSSLAAGIVRARLVEGLGLFLFLLTSISEWNRSKPPNAASAQLVGGAAQLATVGWLLSCTVAAKESERMDEELQGRPAGESPERSDWVTPCALCPVRLFLSQEKLKALTKTKRSSK